MINPALLYCGRTVVPTVITSSILNISGSTAVGGGVVTNSGHAPTTVRGVCWSTSQNPTTGNTKTANGSGLGIFTSNITGLTANTTYYVRAYATNIVGSGYGNQRSFVSSDTTAKYVFSRLSADTSTSASTIAAYDIAYTDASDIETIMQSGGTWTPAILVVQVTFVGEYYGVYLRETINVDKTSSVTFWADINNWLYANNFAGVIYNVGLDKWVIDDSTNHSYLHIKYISG